MLNIFYIYWNELDQLLAEPIWCQRQYIILYPES